MDARLRAWLGFSLTRGIGPVRLQKLLARFGDVTAAWNAAQHELRAAGLSARWIENLMQVRSQVDLDALLARYHEQGISLLTWDDPSYPRRLKQLQAVSPPVLFVRGQLQPQDFWAVAIVGTRRATAYGRQVADELARTLVQQGVTVISGLARGIDTVAHRAAVSAGGRTVAVLGSGVDVIYPPENRQLAEAIMEHGAIVSDYPPGTRPESANFPPRNRLIAGLSLAVVVVEAGRQSGALITAEFAAEQGRDVFAVPGTIYAPQSRGTNWLIRQGAHPLLSPRDLLDALDLEHILQQQDTQKTVPTSDLERQLLDLLTNEARSIDELVRLSGLPTGQVSATLTLMELKGLVRQVAPLRFIAA